MSASEGTENPSFQNDEGASARKKSLPCIVISAEIFMHDMGPNVANLNENKAPETNKVFCVLIYFYYIFELT